MVQIQNICSGVMILLQLSVSSVLLLIGVEARPQHKPGPQYSGGGLFPGYPGRPLPVGPPHPDPGYPGRPLPVGPQYLDPGYPGRPLPVGPAYPDPGYPGRPLPVLPFLGVSPASGATQQPPSVAQQDPRYDNDYLGLGPWPPAPGTGECTCQCPKYCMSCGCVCTPACLNPTDDSPFK